MAHLTGPASGALAAGGARLLRRPPSALLAAAASPSPSARPPLAAAAAPCRRRSVLARAKPKRPKKGGKKGDDDDEDDAAEFRQKPAAAANTNNNNGSGAAAATRSVDSGADDGDETPVMASGMSVTDEAASAAATVAAATAGDSRGGSVGISSGIRLENISKTFKNQQVLRDVSWEVKKGERAGLVGVNGAGKTTQLQIVMGRLQADGGEVVRARKNMRIAYLAQEFDVDPRRTVREEFLSVFDAQLRVEKERSRLSAELETVGEDMARMQTLLDALDKLNATSADLDLGVLDKRLEQMMPELGFTKSDEDRLVASFSGGWQMRMCLGKMLLQDPDLLLLDEPTNHLDLDAIEWLEGYLRRQEIPMVVVSHDREFLDQLCTKIVETERGVASTFPGNYTAYVRQKAERDALQWQAYEKQQKELERQQDLVRRLSGGAQSGRAAAAEKAIERIKTEGLIEKPFVPKRRAFTFPPVERMGQVAVQVDGLTHGYAGRPLFKDASVTIEKGERVAVIGPNGAGKSTLLRLIMGRERPSGGGRCALGEHHIVPNYFEQNQAEALDGNLTVLETLQRAAPDAQTNELKQLLGRMLFSGTAAEKKAKVLSGGEKARLALAKFMCTKGNLLILDEPTNHLDIPSKEMLEEAVRLFEGSVIAVSHDRYFLRRVATRVLMVEGGTIADAGGDYEYLLEKNADEAARMEVKEAKARAVEQATTKAKSNMSKAQRAALKKDKAKAFNAVSAGKGRGAA